MSIKDFKIETDLLIDNTYITLDTALSSGGLSYDQSLSAFKSSDSNIPVGVVRLWSGDSIPENYLRCSGQFSYSKTEYARLYAVIGDRFTSSPNQFTFDLPSFSESLIAGSNPPPFLSNPFPIAINTSNDNANAGVFIQTANQNTISIGGNETTSHSHVSGNSFVANLTSEASLAHTHNTNFGNDTHAHNHDAGSTNSTSHQHGAGNASTAHNHGYTLGEYNYIESGGASGNHTHNYGGESSNHAHNSNTATHTHGTGGPIDQTSNTHQHGFTATLSANSNSHSHQINTTGFYFIIRYQ